MNIVLNSNQRTLISINHDELVGINNALNEVCNDRHFGEGEFQTRLGVTRDFLSGLLDQISKEINQQGDINERTAVWADQGSVHMVCISSFGDPVELNTEEAEQFAKQLQQAIKEAN